MKAKTCRQCEQKFTPTTSSLQVVCSQTCASLYGIKKSQAKIKKQKAARDKCNAEQKRAFKLNDLPYQKKLTQNVFNKLRKLQELEWFADRGKEPECISCGGVKMDWCCGHFKTVGSSGALRFSEKNTYLQCNKNCNSSKAGNIEGNSTDRGFKKGLLERFGATQGQEIIDWCEANQSRVKKWTGQELKEMRKRFNKEIAVITNKS